MLWFVVEKVCWALCSSKSNLICWAKFACSSSKLDSSCENAVMSRLKSVSSLSRTVTELHHDLIRFVRGIRIADRCNVTPSGSRSIMRSMNSEPSRSVCVAVTLMIYSFIVGP